MWKRLLVPCDFSASSDAAVALAVELAGAHRAEITLLHVSDLPANLAAEALIQPPGAAHPVRVDAYVVEGATARLQETADAIGREDVAVCTRAVIGDVAREILRAAEDEAASAIVIGTHGRTGLSHLLLGSVAEKVVRAARVPVVTVRAPGPEAPGTGEERAAEDELAG